jgi:hypothetical protein
MLEQRRYPRMSFLEPVEYRTTSGRESEGCLASDYSIGGMQLVSQKFISLNTHLLLDFISPTRKFLQMAGKVIWVQRVPHLESYRLGISFEKSDQATPQRTLSN